MAEAQLLRRFGMKRAPCFLKLQGSPLVDYVRQEAVLDSPVSLQKVSTGVSLAKEEPKLRKEFPETWIWSNATAG